MRRRHGVATPGAWIGLLFAASLLGAPQALAQVSTDCGDVVSDGVIDVADLDALRRFLTGDPAAPDLQGDPAGLARCDVTGNGQCEIDDYVRIKRYMLDLSGGMNETCPLAGTAYAPAVLAAPTVDQAPTISTDRASVLLSGTVYEPDYPVRITGPLGLFRAWPDAAGAWQVEVPVALGLLNNLSIVQDFGFGRVSEEIVRDANQINPAGGAALEGRVVDATTGDPIFDIATLTISGAAHSTDSFGRFAIPGLPHGVVAVRTEVPGYVPAIVMWKTTGKVFPLADVDANHFELEIGMTPRAPEVMVDSAGGTITTPTGIELVIPPGSLATATPISLTDLAPTGAPGYPFAPVVDIGPGPIIFGPPVVLRIPVGSVPEGVLMDLSQLDHTDLSVAALTGTVASGYLEVPIASSNGDPIGWTPNGPVKVRLTASSPLQVFTYRWPVRGSCEKGTTNRFVFEDDARAFVPTQTGKDRYKGLVEAYSRFPQSLPEEGIILADNSFSLSVGRGELHTYAVTVSYRNDTYGVDFLEPHPQYLDGGVDVRIGHIDVDRVVSRTAVLVESQKLYCGCGSTAFDLFLEEEELPGGLPFSSAVSTPATTTASSPSFAEGETCKGSAWGDPHLVRFDHVGSSQIPSNGNGRYDFQAGGEFVFFESTVDGMTVQTRFVALPGSPSVSITKAAAIDLDGDRVMVDIDASLLRVRVDGVVNALTVGLPVVLPGGGALERLTPANGQDLVVARWGDGSSLAIGLASSLGGYLNLYPELAPGRGGNVQGLLGNANGILGDDYNLRDGTPADPSDLYTVYANNWRISQAESLFDYEPGEDTTTYNTVPPDTEFTLDDLDPANRAAAEAICISAGIDEDPLFSECALDVALLGGAATGGALDTLEQIPDVGTYVAVFGEANIFQAGQASVVDFGGGGGAGLLPTEVPLDPGTGRSMRVLDRAGEVSFSAGTAAIPLDGLDFGEVSWGAWGDVAGPRLRKRGQLMGVFLDSGLPSPVPASFDCGDFDGKFATPAIGQVFCIGDGLSFANEPQTFLVPDAATRLFLGHAERLSNQVIESAVHHLGDNFGTAGLFALAPNPEGVSFISSPFELPTGFTPSSGRVRVDLAETNIGGNSVWVNGQFISYLPVTGASGTTWREDVAFSVDPSILLPTGNWIELRSSGVNLDDYLFKNLRFELAPAVAVLPQPSDPTPYHLGCNCGQAIGDGVGSGNWGLFALMPTPYGTSWTSPPFSVESPETLGGASVVIDVAQTDAGNNLVLVNGTVVGSLPIRPDGTVWSTDVEISFDPALLKKFGNRIEVRSGYLVPGLAEVDDFMMRNARLAVAPEDTVPPGGYADNSGIQELVIDFAAPLDSDGDGLNDSWEQQYFGDLTQDGTGNPDTDGLTNAEEQALGTSPVLADTDGDGLSDGDEVNLYGLDPTVSQKGDIGPRNSPDGFWTVSDLMVMERLVMGAPTSLPESILADINDDTLIDVSDLLLLQQAVFNGTAP